MLFKIKFITLRSLVSRNLTICLFTFRCLHSISSPLITIRPARILGITSAVNSSTLHTSSLQYSYRNTEFEEGMPKKIGKANLVPPNWLKYNDVVYPPTPLGDSERPAVSFSFIIFLNCVNCNIILCLLIQLKGLLFASLPIM